MPQVIIFLDDEEDKIVKEHSKKIDKSKHDTIKDIIRKFGGIK